MNEFEKIVDKWLSKIKGKYLFFSDDRVVSDFRAIAYKAYNYSGSIPDYGKMYDLIYEKYSMDSEIMDEWISFYKECLDDSDSETE